jgi:hypothetical protein
VKRLTEKELAERWGISTRTCQKWRAKGMGPAYIVIGQHTVLYREEDVLAYEQAKRQGGEDIGPWRTAVKRAAACLNTVAQWPSIKPEARATVTNIRDELHHLLGD